MKRFFFTSKMLSMLAILAMTFSTVSCDEDDDHNPTETIATIAGRTENLSTLVTALQKADLVNTLNDKNVSYTVFAPTNQAFTTFLQAKGYSGVADPTLTASALRRILLNHVVNIETYAANLPTDGYLKTLAPSDNNNNTLSLYVNKSSGTRLNGTVNVITKDTRATNGVIHIVDGVIDLPTITTHLRANPSLSTLVIQLNRGGGQPDFASILNGAGPFTIFAPTNNAFSSLNTELTGGMSSLTAGNISDVLRYHIAPNKFLSGQLTNGQIVRTTLVLPTLQTFTVNTTNGLKITDARSRITDIGTVNIEATNGVIHAVNRVLLPIL